MTINLKHRREKADESELFVLVHGAVDREDADTEKSLCHYVLDGAANLADFRTKINKDADMSAAVFS